MKNNSFCIKQILLIVCVCILFQNCNNAQQSSGKNLVQEATEEKQRENPENNTTVTENNDYKFISQLSLPKKIEAVHAMAFSSLNLFIRQDNKIFVLAIAEPEKLLSSFSLINTEGNIIEGITSTSKIAYSDDLNLFFVLTEKDVHFYNLEGKYKGKLNVPVSDFEPYDIAFDLYNNGVYVLSRAEEVGEVYYWPVVTGVAQSVVKGVRYELEIMSIESGFNSSRKSLYLLSALDGIIYEIIQGNDKNWKESGKVDASNGVNLDGMLGSLRSNMTDLFVSGSFENNTSASIRICGQPDYTPNKNLNKGEINDFPEEAMIDITRKKTIVKDFGFYMTYNLYILANNKIFKYKKERK